MPARPLVALVGLPCAAASAVVEAARRAGRPLQTAAAPPSGLAGLPEAVQGAGTAPPSGRLVAWLPGPADLRCSPGAPPADPQEQRAVAALVAAGVRVVAVTSTAGTACSSSAERVAQATGGVAVAPAAAGLTEALSAATVRVRATPVCEAGLTATAALDPITALSGTAVTGRWQVRVEAGARAGAQLSCVVVPQVDAAPALDALHALTVRVTTGAPSGAATSAPVGAAAGHDAATRLSATGEDLLAVRQAQAELSAAAEHLAEPSGSGPRGPDPRLAPLQAVLRSLQERAAVLDARYVALADRATGQATVQDPVPDAPRTELPLPGGPDRPVLPPVRPGGTALAAGDSAARAVAYALAQRGDPYVWGATGPDVFDCSGLTSSAYAAAGVRIPRVSRDQFWAGVPVPRDALLPGDLVFFAWDAGDPRTVHHVGMALGGGLMVHAPKSGDVVRVAPIWSRGYAGAVRIVGAVATTAGPTAGALPPAQAPGSRPADGTPGGRPAPAGPPARPSAGAAPRPSVSPSPSPRPAAPPPSPTRTPAGPSSRPSPAAPAAPTPSPPTPGPTTPAPPTPAPPTPAPGADAAPSPTPAPTPTPTPTPSPSAAAGVPPLIVRAPLLPRGVGPG